MSNTSNPKDLDLLFAMHSYPAHKCFLLRDRGFVILGANVADVKATLRMLAPLLRSPASDAGVDSTDEDGVSNGARFMFAGGGCCISQLTSTCHAQQHRATTRTVLSHAKPAPGAVSVDIKGWPCCD